LGDGEAVIVEVVENQLLIDLFSGMSDIDTPSRVLCIELSYHLNELSVARSGVNTDDYQLTINQKTLIKEFEAQYPGWRIDIGHAREEVNEKLILNHLNYHRFTITQRDLFA
jgi:hypothetical protein